MDQKLQDVLNFLVRPAVEYNLPENRYWGVVLGENSVMVASGFFMLEINNIKFDERPEGPFFSYFENKFTDYSYPLNPNQMLDAVNAQSKFVNRVTFPLTNLINRLEDIEKNAKIDKTRIIISPGYKLENELLINFTFNGSEWEFRHHQLPKPITVNPSSIVPSELVRENVIYRCKIEDELLSSITVNVIEPYGKMRMGILYSPQGFIPNNMENINRMTGIIPPDMIIGSNEVAPEIITAPPIHLDGSMINDLLKVFILTSDFVEFHLPDDPNKPVMITNIKKSPDDLDIRAFVATLNPFYGAQRR